MSNQRDRGSDERIGISNPSTGSRGHSSFRGRATDRRGPNRGLGRGASTLSAGGRPTHCKLPSILHIHDI